MEMSEIASGNPINWPIAYCLQVVHKLRSHGPPQPTLRHCVTVRTSYASRYRVCDFSVVFLGREQGGSVRFTSFPLAIVLGVSAVFGRAECAIAQTDDNVLFSALKEASISSTSKLESGVGEGIYRVSVRNLRSTGQPAEFSDNILAITKISFKRHKIRIEISEDPVRMPNGRTKQVFLCDGQMVVRGDFAKSLMPKGCSAVIVDVGEIPMTNAGFTLDPIYLRGMVPNLGIQHSDTYVFGTDLDGAALGVRKFPDGSRMEIRALASVGYNLTEYSSFPVGAGATPVERVNINWSQADGGVWFPKKITWLRVISDEKGKREEIRIEHWFERFQANIGLTEGTLTLASLGLVEGVRILDERREAKVRELSYRQGEIGASKSHLDSLLESVELLPPQYGSGFTDRPFGQWIIRASAVAIAIFGLVWLCRRFRKRG